MFNYIQERSTKSFAKGLYRAMVTSALAFKNKYPELKAGRDASIAALSTRSTWEQDSENEAEFTFKETGTTIIIREGDSIAATINKVGYVELSSINSGLKSQDQVRVISAGMNELSKLTKLPWKFWLSDEL